MTWDLENELCCAWPPNQWQDVTVVVAVSGGADSVALLRALAAVRPAARGSLVAAHLDHGLRPESADDARFVRELARDLGLECLVESAELAGSSAEEAARQARYEFLRRAAHRLGARFVATGHTFDDQAETILHRVVRGAGLRGLSGIPRLRSLSELTTVVRPLLDVRHQQAVEYLQQLGQNWREDPSNRWPQFTRNRLRREVLPLLEQLNPAVRESLVRLGELAGQAQQALDAAAGELLERAQRSEQPRSLELDCQVLSQTDRSLAQEALRLAWRRADWPLGPMTQTHWQQLTELACGEGPAACDFPGPVHARRDGATLRLNRSRGAETRPSTPT